MTRAFSSPLWLVGFRPFFLMAFISGAVLPLAWGLAFSGVMSPALSISALQWHAHEMFFGFAWAVMAGFLLTASKNWVKIRGMHGGALALAVFIWATERFLFFAGLSTPLLAIATSLSVLYVVSYVVFSLVKFRERDSFKDNWFFIMALPLFLLAKVLLLLPETFHLGWPMTVGLFRLAFLIMLERTTTQFMKTRFDAVIVRYKWLDMAIKVSALASVFEAFFPTPIGTLVVVVLAVFVMARLTTWKPLLGLTNFGIAVMYVGHIAIPVHLLLYALMKLGLLGAVGDVATHVFAFVTMGTIIPAMLIRISQGHTGRPIAFTSLDRLAISIMWLGAFLRLVAPQFSPERYSTWVMASAVCWSLCFVLIGVRLSPMLVRARVDGKEH